jgi:hypothetical protein
MRIATLKPRTVEVLSLVILIAGYKIGVGKKFPNNHLFSKSDTSFTSKEIDEQNASVPVKNDSPCIPKS